MNTPAHKATYTLLLLTSFAFLNGCGVKPAYVDPPSGAEHDTFPAVYPAPVTQIQPGLENKDLANKNK